MKQRSLPRVTGLVALLAATGSAVILFAVILSAQAAPPCGLPPCGGGSGGGPITITEVQPLSFPPQVAGIAQVVTVTAADATAAVFIATGDANTPFTASVVEGFINITNGGGGAANKMRVDGWTFGGNLTDGGGSGSGTFDGTGNITNLRVGASVTEKASNVAGSYAGSATFRIVY